MYKDVVDSISGRVECMCVECTIDRGVLKILVNII